VTDAPGADAAPARSTGTRETAGGLRLVSAEPGLRARATAQLTDLGYAAGWRAVRALPEPVARGAFDAAGRWAAAREGRGVRQLRANLRVATGGRLDEAALDELTARGVRSYARYWQEAFRLPRLSRERIVADTVSSGVEHMERARAAGRTAATGTPPACGWWTSWAGPS
jgi:lauroyl/myristoyl acyltransferase